MRVLHTVAPAEFGGLEEVIVRLTRGLRDAGHDAQVGAIFSGKPAPHPVVEALRGASVPVHSIFVPPRRYGRETEAVRDLIRRLRPDVLHTHGYRPDVLHSRAARDAGRPCVSTLHGFTGGDGKNRLYEWLQVWSARYREVVIAVSRPIADRIRDAGVPPGRIRVIPNAWSVRTKPLPADEARRVLEVPNEALLIGWVGRLGPEKGPDLFVHAMERLKGENVRASVLGDGRSRHILEARASNMGLPVTFHGAVPDAGRVFSALDVFVLTSRTEGTPMVLFEAMEADVPIVATAVGGVPDVLDHTTAILIPPEDPEAIADGIRSILRNPDAARARAKRARERLHTTFALKPWIRSHEEAYGFAAGAALRARASP